MADGSDDQDKQHEPTQKKLDDARKKGEIPRSADLTTAASYVGILVSATAIGAASLKGIGAELAGVMGRADRLAPDVFNGGGVTFAGALMIDLAGLLAPWFMIPAARCLSFWLRPAVSWLRQKN